MLIGVDWTHKHSESLLQTLQPFPLRKVTSVCAAGVDPTEHEPLDVLSV